MLRAGVYGVPVMARGHIPGQVLNTCCLVQLRNGRCQIGDYVYRFGWDETKTIHEAEVLPISIVSGVQTDLEVLSNPFGGKGLIVADHERTMEQAADDGPGYFRYVNPWRESEYPWRCVDAADFDGLLARTDEFGRDLLAELERDVA